MPNPELPNTGVDTGENIGETIDRETAEARGEMTIEAKEARDRQTLEAMKAELEARRKLAEDFRQRHKEIKAKIASQEETNKSLMAELKALENGGTVATEEAPAETEAPAEETLVEEVEAADDLTEGEAEPATEPSSETAEALTPDEKLAAKEKGKNHRGLKHLVSAMLALVVLAGCNGDTKGKAEDEAVFPTPNPIVETATANTTPNDLGLIWEDEAETPDDSEDEFAGPEDIVYEAVDEEETPAPVETAELSFLAAAEFIPNGVVSTKNGDLQKFTYRGGYREENDPYSIKFAHQGEKGYENDTAYGLAIKGKTETEMTANWLKRVVASPEAIVRLRVQLGLERLQSIEEENVRANEIRNMSADDYDQIANDTIEAFYSRIKGGSIKKSKGWALENFMNDEASGNHENAAVHGRLNGDDDKDTLLTFFDKNGENIVSSMRGFLNTREDANTTRKDIGSEAWVNMDEGGSWKWKVEAMTMSVINSYMSGPVAPATIRPSGGSSTPTPTPAPKSRSNTTRIDTNISQSLPTATVKPNTSGQQQANSSATPVNQAPTGGQARQDALADLGIN